MFRKNIEKILIKSAHNGMQRIEDNNNNNNKILYYNNTK